MDITIKIKSENKAGMSHVLFEIAANLFIGDCFTGFHESYDYNGNLVEWEVIDEVSWCAKGRSSSDFDIQKAIDADQVEWDAEKAKFPDCFDEEEK